MWHASIAAHNITLPDTELQRRAFASLRGVGDARAGQWVEITERAAHVRRRLLPTEVQMLPLDHRQVVDVRAWSDEDISLIVEPTMHSWGAPRIQATIADLARQELQDFSGEDDG